MISIDVVVPSYRMDSEYLIPIINMKIPNEAKIRFLIICDNPNTQSPKDLEQYIDNINIILFRNLENLGSSKSRNVGIDNSKADWILFLDDDVKPNENLLCTYIKAINENKDDVGFFGETIFPPPKTIFTKGIIACDILTFFFLAGYYNQLKWAPTSNVIIKRSVIGNIRFREIFPKNGGGEDIDFFLHIFKNSKRELQCLKNAQVFHNWWYNQKRNYTRFIRWSYGDTLLHDMYPEYTYYNFPNIIESLLFGSIVSGIVSINEKTILPFFCIIFGILIGEVIIEFIRLITYKGVYQSLFTLEAVLIRASNDIGRLTMQLFKLKRPKGIFERFDHFCDGKHIKYQRIWAGTKFISYTLFTVGLYLWIK